MVKVFVFLCHFWPRIQISESFCFSWSFLAKVTNGESFWFFSLFGQGYQWWKLVFSWSFLAKDTNGESSVFSWSFLANVTNGEIFWFFSLFGQGYQRWKLCFFLVVFGQGYQRWKLCFSLTFLVKVTFIGHFGYEYQWWKLYLWFEILSNLWHPALANTSSRSLEPISGTPLCKQEFALREATAGMGLQVRVYSYTSRQALACKYEYLIPRNGRLIQKPRSPTLTRKFRNRYVKSIEKKH